MGIRAVRGTDGVLAYTVADAARLLACSEAKVRKTVLRDAPGVSAGTKLCDAATVDHLRADLLARLGAIEADAGPTSHDQQTVTEQLWAVEERLRLFAASRSAALESWRHALAEEQAVIELAMVGLTAPK